MSESLRWTFQPSCAHPGFADPQALHRQVAQTRVGPGGQLLPVSFARPQTQACADAGVRRRRTNARVPWHASPSLLRGRRVLVRATEAYEPDYGTKDHPRTRGEGKGPSPTQPL